MKTHAGVAIGVSTGQLLVGRLAENAAYNPSMSPLESVLTMWSLTGDQTSRIARIVLVEKASATVSQEAVTRALLPALGTPGFERRTAH